MIRTYYVSDADIGAEYAELDKLYDLTAFRALAEATRRALVHVTWKWRAASQVLDNAERKKRWHLHATVFHTAGRMSPSLQDLQYSLRDPGDRAHFDRIQRGEYP